MFSKENLKRAALNKSINFADSLTAQSNLPQAQPPEYSIENQTAEQAENQPYETGGSITFYCNGFLPERDYLGNESRGQQAEKDEGGNGETMHQTDSTIEGGQNYWGSIDEQLEERFTGKEPNADSTFYFDGSAGPLSSAKDRMEYGEAAAQMIIRQVQSGQFTLDENGCLPDNINVVGHSMGAAYAAGLTKGLLAYNAEQGKQIFNVRAVYYFAPHQPMDIEHPSEVRGVQYSHKNDAVTSGGDDASSLWGLIPKGSGSTLAPISGIHEFMVHDVPGLDQSLIGDRGGHNITDHEYALTKYKKGRDGYIAPNSDTDYDSENYNHQVTSNEGYEKRSVHLPQIIDKLEGLPDDMRNKIDEIKAWLQENVNDANSAFKSKVGQGRDWVDEKREDGKGWIDDKLQKGEDWVDDKVDKGNEKVDDEINKVSGWLKKKSGGLLGDEVDKLSDWVRGKKNKGVDAINEKKEEGFGYVQGKADEANAWLKDKTSDLASWVTEKSDDLSTYVNDEVNKISSWAKKQVSKGEKYVERTAKAVQRKLKALIKKIQYKLEKIRERVNKIIAIIKEAKAWS